MTKLTVLWIIAGVLTPLPLQAQETRSASEAEEAARAMAQEEHPADDYGSVGIWGSFAPGDFDGEGETWTVVLYAPSQRRLTIVALTQFLSGVQQSEVLPAGQPTIDTMPEDYVDSPALMATVTAQADVASFIDTHGEERVSVRLFGGPYARLSEGMGLVFLDEDVWVVEMSASTASGQASVTAYIDMNTGEVLDVETGEEPSTNTAAGAYQAARASAGVPSTVQPLGIYAVNVQPDGTSATGWTLQLYDEASSTAYVGVVTPFGSAVMPDPEFEPPDPLVLIPDPFVDSDRVMAAADSAGGQAFRDRFGTNVSTIGMFGGFGLSEEEEILEDFPEYRGVPLWAVYYVAFDLETNEAASFVVFVDMQLGTAITSQGTNFAVATEPTARVGGRIDLGQPYPNPVRREAIFLLTLPRPHTVEAVVYDVLGRRTAVLADDVLAAGTHRLVWNAERFAAGPYVLRVEVGDQVFVRVAMVASR